MFFLKLRLRGDVQATTTLLQACRAHYVETVLQQQNSDIRTQEAEASIYIPYMYEIIALLSIGRSGEGMRLTKIGIIYREGGLINEKTIKEMEDSLKSKVDKEKVTYEFKLGNYTEVVGMLEQRLGTTSDRASIPHHDRLYLLGILAEAHHASGNCADALRIGQLLLQEALRGEPATAADIKQSISLLLSCTRRIGHVEAPMIKTLMRDLQQAVRISLDLPNRYVLSQAQIILARHRPPQFLANSFLIQRCATQCYCACSVDSLFSP